MSIYKQAQKVVAELKVDKHISLEIGEKEVALFRKYLRDFSKDNVYTTKVVDNKLRITRLK